MPKGKILFICTVIGTIFTIIEVLIGFIPPTSIYHWCKQLFKSEFAIVELPKLCAAFERLNDEQTPVCIVMYPFRFDDAHFSATNHIAAIIITMLDNIDKKKFKIVKAYSNASCGEYLSDVLTDGEQSLTILKLAGEVKYWSDDKPDSLVLQNVCLSKFENNQWNLLVCDTYRDSSRIPRFPKIWHDHSIDKVDEYLSRQEEFKVAQGMTGGKFEDFAPEKYIQSSIDNARAKIKEQDITIVKQIVVERNQNDFQTTFTYILNSF